MVLESPKAQQLLIDPLGFESQSFIQSEQMQNATRVWVIPLNVRKDGQYGYLQGEAIQKYEAEDDAVTKENHFMYW